MTPDPIEKFTEKAHDLDAARKSVEDAASLSGGLWLSYLFALFYIGIAAGAVTHKDLLLESPVKLPFLQVELPLVAFFALAPILFVISHAYTLMYFVLLAAKVGTFNAILARKIPDPDATPTNDISSKRAAELRETRLGLRRQLPSNIFVQFLAGPRDIRDGGLGWLLKAVAWISLVIGPVLLLLLLQIQFLPYHLAWVTWVQRVALAADVALLWFLWPAVLASRCEIRWPRLWRHPVLTLASLIPIGLALIVARFPGEWIDAHMGNKQWIPTNLAAIGLEAANAKDPPKWSSFHDLFFNGDVNELTRQRTSPFSHTIVLPRFDALKAAKIDNLDAVKQTLTLNGRHLEKAVFYGADLRKASLEGAHLQGASLYQAKLQGARFYNANLQGASLYQSKLQCASLNLAKLQGASLAGATLVGAYADLAELQGASLKKADIRGASLNGAKLQGAGFGDEQQLALSADPVADLRAEIEKDLHGFDECQAALKRMEPSEEGRSSAVAKRLADDNAFADELKGLVCSGDENAAYIVRGFIKNELIGATPAQAHSLVEAILHPKTTKDCPVFVVLTKEEKAALIKIADAPAH